MLICKTIKKTNNKHCQKKKWRKSKENSITNIKKKKKKKKRYRVYKREKGVTLYKST